ncbi:A/G-specific adenine glycosylase [Moelleriella libera RCEF 2490]|uniref:Adenine DNA glycosylase n=1 Tax=Moelleriella libera RCEF 2490 TaxID=1081109 RepID=A0A167YT11_9HYPO|nr:A/G-specific adenine glycosylase [Moelleriella libera RCEF 2490]
MAGKRVLRAPSAPAARRPSTRASSHAGPRRASSGAPSDDDDSFSEPDNAAADDDDHDHDHDGPRGNKRRKVAAAVSGGHKTTQEDEPRARCPGGLSLPRRHARGPDAVLAVCRSPACSRLPQAALPERERGAHTPPGAARVLGIHGNVKTEKRVVDTIWAAADALVKAVALLDGDRPEDDGQRLTTTTDEDVSDRPGRWGQALMELGSTVCTLKPNCAQCPVTASCRVYAEAETLVRPSSVTGAVPRDIEDACTLCEPFDEPIEHDPALAAPRQSSSAAAAAAKSRHAHPAKPVKAAAATRQRTLADFAFTGSSGSSSSPKPSPPLPPKQRLRQDAQIADAIASYARRFPLKTVKKALRAEQVLVCAIRRPNGTYLIRRRPDKGLLAGLWEFPSTPLPPTPPPPPPQQPQQQPQEQEEGEHQPLTSKQRIILATEFAAGLFERTGGQRGRPRLRHVADLGSVPWVFSHLKLTMHVHLFTLSDYDGDGEQHEGEEEEEECTLRCGDDARWTADVEGESMGTGMRKCWALVRDAETW